MFKTGRFTRYERVKRSNEIKNIFNRGKKVSVQGAKLFYIENGMAFNRIAFALPRGYGNAVSRNHSKRLSREAYRSLKRNLLTGYDFVFLTYPGSDSFDLRFKMLENLLQKAGVYKA